MRYTVYHQYTPGQLDLRDPRHVELDSDLLPMDQSERAKVVIARAWGWQPDQLWARWTLDALTLGTNGKAVVAYDMRNGGHRIRGEIHGDLVPPGPW